MNKNDGSFLERLVQVIEQSLAPESIVQRNVKLPILGSKTGTIAQCDIVIRTGKPPRETITIVEVQDRQKPVDINEFRGWQQKLQDVGAQHLYCISRKPFPESIKEKAALSGNAIKLITLTALNDDQIPINFFQTKVIYYNIDVPQVRKKEVIFPTLQDASCKEKLDIVTQELSLLKTNDLKFSFDLQFITALSTICIKRVSNRKDVSFGIDTLELGFERTVYFFYANKEFIPIQLRIEFAWTSERLELPITILSYEQDDHGALAWVLESIYDSPRGPILTKIPVIKSGNEYSISGMFVTMPETMELTLHLEK